MSAVNVLGNHAVSQPFRVTETGAIGGPGGRFRSEGIGGGEEIETRSKSRETDRVSISPEGKRLAAGLVSSSDTSEADSKGAETDDSPKSRFESIRDSGKAEPEEQSESSKTKDTSGAEKHELSPEEEQEVLELKERDREVRAHEMAHKAAAGSLATGGPVYEFETGPDGREYAVGGHVSIRIPKGKTPAETIRIAQQAKRAALAPSSPSGQDRSVAVEAQSRVFKAQKKMSQDQVEQFGELKEVRRSKRVKAEEIEEARMSSTEASPLRGEGSEGTSENAIISEAERAPSVSDAIEFRPFEPGGSPNAKKITDAYNQISDFSEDLALAGCGSCRKLECGCAIA